MTSAERFLIAVRNGVPDRVPVTPDISNYIPAKRTGLPFWDLYFHHAIPFWQVYLDAADYYGIDAWMASCCGAPLRHENANLDATSELVFDAARDAMIRKSTTKTPHGTLTSETLCYRADPPSPIVKPIKDLQRDWPAYRDTLSAPVSLDLDAWQRMRDDCTRRGHAFGVCLGYPGFQAWIGAVQGGVEQLAYATLDCPEILDEWHELALEHGTRAVELTIAARPDYILWGGSGTITLASPELALKYAIPALKRWSAMTRAAGIPTLLHSCGNSRALVDLLVEHTSVDCINPLEMPPMGDVDLAEVKRARGDRIALMGNLHTTKTMLFGTVDQVKAAALDAIRAAGDNGGFILSSGDQCPRDTPDANLFALKEVVEKYGVYDSAGHLPRLPALGAVR